MDRQIVEVDAAKLHAPVGPVSHGVVARGSRMLFVSGQIPVDASGALVGAGDLGRQYRQVLENIRTVVEAAGGELANVCSLVNYLTVPVTASDPAYLDMAAVREELFGRDLPASSLVEVTSLMVPGVLVETEAVALLD